MRKRILVLVAIIAALLIGGLSACSSGPAISPELAEWGVRSVEASGQESTQGDLSEEEQCKPWLKEGEAAQKEMFSHLRKATAEDTKKWFKGYL